MNTYHGGIDAGGTTFKCGILSAAGEWVAKSRIPTSSPDETVAGCVAFFEHHALKLASLGVAAFGPVDIDPTSATYGTILETPKPRWSGVGLKTRLDHALGVDCRFDTDVNGALTAEMIDGAAHNAQSAAYVTVGTGIGAGIFANGAMLGRPSHPEFGHIYVKRHPSDGDYKGRCPFHEDCLEGLASAGALTDRWGDPRTWADDHVGWDIAAHYLAQACLVLSLTVRVERIILGGGLMLSPLMRPKVITQYLDLADGYLGQSAAEVDKLIVTPGHGDDAGLRGAVYVGQGRQPCLR